VFAGGDVEFVEPDWNAVNETLDSSYRDRVGEIVNWMVEGFAGRLEYLYHDDAVFSEALQLVWKSKKLAIKLGKFKVDESHYHKLSVVDGVLVITAHDTNVAANTDQIGTNIVVELKLKTDSGIPYFLKKNIDKYQEELNDELKAIAEVTGISGVSLHPVDYVKMNTTPVAKDYENRMAEIVLWLIQGLKANVSRLVADDLAKEALQEAWNGQIELKYDPKYKDPEEEHYYSGCTFVAKKLLITYRDSANADLTGSKIEKLL